MSFGIVAGVVGPIIGGIIGGNAAEDAANAQVKAASDANATQLQIFNQIREDQSPWRNAGRAGLAQLLAGFGEDPNEIFGASSAPSAPLGGARPASAGQVSDRRFDLSPEQEVQRQIMRINLGREVLPQEYLQWLGGGLPSQVDGSVPSVDGSVPSVPIPRQFVGSRPQADFNRDFGMADFQADPGYAFRMNEANKALERSAAARGGLLSGGTLRALTRYNQDAASQEYQNAFDRFNTQRTGRFNRLASLAGLGQTANAQNQQAAQNYANQFQQNTAAIGSARGAQAVGTANAWTDAISGAGAGLRRFLDRNAYDNPYED